MPSSKKTTLGLNQWEADDRPTRIDYNNDNKIVNDALVARTPPTGYRKLVTFHPTGSYTFYPAQHGLKAGDTIGYFMCGGGGSGGTANGKQFTSVTGGAAGASFWGLRVLTETDVSNGMPATVGRGGSKVTAFLNQATSNAGAATTFASKTCAGGEGGKASQTAEPSNGASGGQGSDSASPDTVIGLAPANAVRSSGAYGGGKFLLGGATSTMGAANPFEPYAAFLGAGGYATLAHQQQTPPLTYGSGAAGTLVTAPTSTENTGVAATGYGNGGGALLVNNDSGTKTGLAGVGAPGVVIIYAP